MAAPASSSPIPSGPSAPSHDDAFDGIVASETSDLPVIITNAISVVACVLVVTSYFYFRHKNQRIMERNSLVLAAAMASADLLLHSINLFGYSDLPNNFVCSFFGGFLYAFPTLVSIFYSFCIALNTQLVFVFGKRPGQTKIKYYIGIPIALSLCICVPALGAGLYGYDASFDMCWYSTEGKTSRQVLIPYFLTFAFWCLLAILYLIIAAVSIIVCVFSKDSRLNRLASSLTRSISVPSTPRSPRSPRHPQYTERFSRSVLPGDTVLNTNNSKSDYEHIEPPSPGAIPQSPGFQQRTAFSITQSPRKTLSRRSLAMRALAFRLLGYITIPTVCILPGVINDLVVKAMPREIAEIPGALSTFFDSLNGLVGLFNAFLYAMDPALLALYHQLWVEYKERKQAATGDVEMANTNSRLPNGVEVRHEQRKSKTISQILTSKRSRQSLNTGIVIRVDVEIDHDNDLDRLESYLMGL